MTQTSNFETILLEQKRYFESGKTWPVSFRKAQLRALLKQLKQHEEELCKAVFDDFGKSAIEIFMGDLAVVYQEIRWLLCNIDRLAKPKRCRTNLGNLPGKSRIIMQPIGTVLILGAWNYPYNLTLVPLVSAIGAGCTAVVKPSELPTHAMKILSKIISSTFPKEYIFLAEGGAEVASYLTQLKFDKIFFTGSTGVGKMVYQSAARNMVPVTLELGGKSPVIVSPSADLAKAAKRIVWGKFFNAGQTCVAPDYLLLHRSLKQTFLEYLVGEIKTRKYDQGAEQYVSIVTSKHLERLIALISSEKVYYGGGYDLASRYLEPTIMVDVEEDDPIMQEEIFGPILPIILYDHFDDVLKYIGRKEKPLAAYLFSQSKEERKAFLTKLNFGGGCINDVVMHLNNIHLPFGGVGASGIGEYHGEAGFLNFIHPKSVFVRSKYFEPTLKYPPYTKWKKRIIRWLLG